MTEAEKQAALDKPFGQVDAPAGEPAIEPKKIEEKVFTVEEEKARVPYSRFENVSKARREAEAEAEKWRNRAIELEESRFTHTQSEAPKGDVPSWWTKIYGDGDNVKEAYGIWAQEQEHFVSRAEEKALERLREERGKEQESVRENLSALDEHLELVSGVAGHDLTEKEQEDILDIIDDYTAKDDDGNYLGAILPADKAWEIYELKHKASTSQSKQSRDSVAGVISSPTNGEPSQEQQERDKTWRPWSYRDKLPKD